MKYALIIIAILAAAAVAAVFCGAHSWANGTRQLRARIDDAREPLSPAVIDFRELEGLPKPVQRFFRATLTDGQPMVAAVHLSHEGTFDMGESADRWKPFSSEQWVVTRRPGFDWDGRIRMMPGLTVFVHDAYVEGEGILRAALSGLVTLAEVTGGDRIAQGELMRFLAEAAWYPTALLPSQGVDWAPVDERSALATLADGAISVTLLFSFNDAGHIDTVAAEARGRAVGEAIIPTKWRGRFWNHQERGGMVVPLEGEVAWLPAQGEKPYWRGHITTIEYELAR